MVKSHEVTLKVDKCRVTEGPLSPSSLGTPYQDRKNKSVSPTLMGSSSGVGPVFSSTTYLWGRGSGESTLFRLGTGRGKGS